jgi:ribosomal protein L37E
MGTNAKRTPGTWALACARCGRHWSVTTDGHVTGVAEVPELRDMTCASCGVDTHVTAMSAREAREQVQS